MICVINWFSQELTYAFIELNFTWPEHELNNPAMSQLKFGNGGYLVTWTLTFSAIVIT